MYREILLVIGTQKKQNTVVLDNKYDMSKN